MKRKIFVTILLWLLAVSVMALIFYMSAQNADESSSTSGGLIETIIKYINPNFEHMDKIEQYSMIEQYQFIVRKLAHFTIYTALGFFIAIAFNYNVDIKIQRIATPFLIGAVYACTDEIHQKFVPMRSGEIRDVFIDSCGVILGVLIAFLIYLIVDAHRRKKELNKATF